VGDVFAAAALQLLESTGCTAQQLRAIGSHGQTRLHRPRGKPAFTMQIGDPNRIAERTGIDVVADFRRRDVAAGGEGAPLVPAFHAAAFAAAGATRVVVNIGGIANITVLAADGNVTGFDTGPGNCLMDLWSVSTSAPFDRDGHSRASARFMELLRRLLTEPYLARPAPKSTGRELFNRSLLDAAMDGLDAAPAAVQSTLCEYTATTLSAHSSCPRARNCGSARRRMERSCCELAARLPAPGPVDR
jgi:anhydro-N-acetylmuramic acid kinase